MPQDKPTTGDDHTPHATNSHLLLNGVFGEIAVRAKKSTTNTRGETIERIITLAPTIIAKHNAKFVSAAAVKAEITADTGLHFNANFLGDCLGGHGLKLPHISKRSKMRYALHMVRSTDEEKGEVQAALDALTPQERAALIVA